MRNLTITRRKSFVGCAMKDQVYIRDTQAPELTIDGVPCRKIGEIKNEQSKNFLIGDEEQQIFLIADKLSKNYCNATVTIPAGQEDVALSGVHKFVYGSNPFRFDGVELTEEEKKKQKKNNRKGTWITIGAVLFGLVVGNLVGLFLPGGFLNPEKTPAKDFVKEDFKITLTEDFEETDMEGFFAFYTTEKVMVFTVREEKVIFGDLTLEEYGSMVLKANGRDNVKMNQGEGFVWFEYTDTPEEQEIYYLAACFAGEDAFWIVNFATPATNREMFKEQFLDWAETVKVG